MKQVFKGEIMMYIRKFKIKNKLKKRYYKLKNYDPLSERYLLKEFKRWVFFFVPCNKPCFWENEREFERKYTRV